MRPAVNQRNSVPVEAFRRPMKRNHQITTAAAPVPI
jgi:hypothetical protein